MTEPDLGPILMRVLEDVSGAATPLIPEIAVSQLLGTVWSRVDGPREEGVAYFCEAMVEQLRPYGGKARPMLEVLARQAPAAVAASVAGQVSRLVGAVPAWLTLLDTVELLGAFSSIDAFGDQENFVMHFGYRDGREVVGQHILIALVDHRLDLLKDAFLVGPQIDFTGIRHVFDSNPDLTVNDDMTPAYIASQVIPAMAKTDEMVDLGILGDETSETWYLLRSRMATCFEDDPGLTSTQRSRVVTRFLGLKPVQQMAAKWGLDRASLRVLVRAIVDYENDVMDGQWNPIAVEMFFMGWALDQDWQGHEQALGDVLVEYLIWTMKAQDYAPATGAARYWHEEFMEQR